MKKLYHIFVEDVSSGKLLSCQYVKLAVQRHLDDIEKSKDPDFDFYFDEDLADKAIKFIKLCRHTDGDWSGKYFDLQPFQAFPVAMMFGWVKKENKKRRFKKAYLEIARKNGKSELLAAICLYMLFADGEKGAQVYTFATEKKQAKVVFDISVQMLRMLWKDSPGVAAKIAWNKTESRIFLRDSNAYMEPLSDDADKKDGLRPHFAAGDEAHAWKTFKTLKVLETGTGNRSQHLICMITTAGPNIFGPAFRFRKTCIEILEGRLRNEQIFSIIFTLDPDDDWEEPQNWPKANPNIGNSPLWESMQEMYDMAITEGEEAEIQFRTKNLNQWQYSNSTWISIKDLRECSTDFKPDILKDRKCWIGIHCARPKEIVSIVRVFPKDNDEGVWIYPTYLIPSGSILKLTKRHGIPYADHINDGYLQEIEGKIIREEDIEQIILNDSELYDIAFVEYDKKYLYRLMARLEDEYKINTSAFVQSDGNYTSPTLAIETEVLEKRFDIGTNPITEFHISNVELVSRADVTAIDRRKANVGAVIAMCMAMGGYETDTPIKKVSKYASEDIAHE